MEPTLPQTQGPGPTSDGSSPVHHILCRLRKERSPAEMVAALRTLERPRRSKAVQREIKSLIRNLEGHLATGGTREAVAVALAAMFADGDYAIGKMRRGGVLRASRYGYTGMAIANVARAALDARASLDARDDRFDYLRSILAPTRLAPDAKVLHDRMVKILSARENVALKTVLAIVNSRFYHHGPADDSLSSLRLGRYTVEDVSEAASLVLDTYRQLFTIHDHCCNEVDAEGVAGPAPIYERLLVAAIRLTKFRDAEVMVDGLPFQARWERGAVRVSAIDANVEKSIRLGYLQGQTQVMIRVRHMIGSEPAMSVREMIEKGFERGALDWLVELVEWPVKRFRLSLPTAPQFFGLFRSDDVFRDELESLLIVDADSFGELDPDLQVTPQVTMRDLLKIQRYFNFISCLYQRKLQTIEDEGERAYLAFTSTIPVIPHDRLLQQMQLIFGDARKARAIIDLLVIDYGASHLDLQYTPLVDLSNYYVVAPHLLAASNLVRNVTVAKKLRKFALRAGDPMVAAVIAALEARGFKVGSGVEVTVGGKTVELDLAAWRDGVLFLFECKNAYHPCSAHETRNSFEHIRVARDQLDVRREIFRDPVNQTSLFGTLGWDVRPTEQLFTGIVIANRIFNGAEFNGHPVRQAHELINVLRTGTIGGDVEFRFWKEDAFATQDLINYLTRDSVATKSFDAMEPYPIEIDLGGRLLVFESYAIDPQKQLEIMEKSYGLRRPKGGYAAYPGSAT
jgi:hypothetical protein